MKKYFLLPFVFTLSSFSLTVQGQGALVSDSVRIDGHYRSFHYHKTPSVDAGASLIFVLHGSGSTGKQWSRATAKLQEKAAAENFILVYPDGYKKYWNECRKTASSQANIENIDEIAFFDAMIHYFKTRYRIHDRQVFAVGVSGGGHMAYKLALTTQGKFKAITAIIANLPDDQNMDCAAVKAPISVMIINGTDDPVNPYNGGLVQTGSFRAGTVRSTEKTLRYWADLAGYKGEPLKSILPDTDPADGRIIEKYVYSRANTPEVVLLKVIGGKHDNPGDINVYVEAWEFFKRQINQRP